MNNWNDFEDRISEIEKWGENHQQRLSEMNKGCFEPQPSKWINVAAALLVLILMAFVAAFMSLFV
jgi:hypothetical protein